MKTLEAFYLKCLWQIFRARWHQDITELEMLSNAGVVPLAEQITRRRTAPFGHIAWLANSVPALCCHIDASLGCPPRNTWKRRPGRPRNRWLDLVQQDSDCSPAALWRRAVLCGHGARTVQQPSPAVQTWWWWWWIRHLICTICTKSSGPLVRMRIIHVN